MFIVYTNKAVLDTPTAENNWNGYFEYQYSMFDSDGNLVMTGSEDFSSQRAKSLRSYLVRVPNGRVNKSGGIMTDVVGKFWLGKIGSPSLAAKFLYGEKAKAEKV